MSFAINSHLKRYILSIPEVQSQGLEAFLLNQYGNKTNIMIDKINTKIAVVISNSEYLALQISIKQLNEDYGFFKDNVKFYIYTSLSLYSITRLYTEFKHNVIFIYRNDLVIDDIIMLDEFCTKNSITCFYSTVPITTNTIINYSTSNDDIKTSYVSLLNNINDILTSSTTLQNIGSDYTHAMIILEDNSVNTLFENALLRQDYNVEIDTIVRVNSTNDTFTNEIVNYLSNPNTNNTHMCIINIVDPSYLFRNINSIITNNPTLNERLFIVNGSFIRTKPTFNINGILTLFTNVDNFEKYSSFLNSHNEVSVNKLLKIGSIVQDLEPLIVKMNNKNMGKDLMSELKKMMYVIKDNVWYNDIILYLNYTNRLINNITYDEEGVLFTFKSAT